MHEVGRQLPITGQHHRKADEAAQFLRSEPLEILGPGLSRFYKTPFTPNLLRQNP